jgi:hypothetical protein
MFYENLSLKASKQTNHIVVSRAASTTIRKVLYLFSIRIDVYVYMKSYLFSNFAYELTELLLMAS